jgi:hypothetical protein
MSTIQDFKDIYELLKKFADVEMQEKFMAIREENVELREENLTLKTQNKELEDKLRTRERLVFDGSVYWLKEQDGSMDGPYCQRCYDDRDKLIRLQDSDNLWCCHRCLISGPASAYYKKRE